MQQPGLTAFAASTLAPLLTSLHTVTIVVFQKLLSGCIAPFFKHFQWLQIPLKLTFESLIVASQILHHVVPTRLYNLILFPSAPHSAHSVQCLCCCYPITGARPLLLCMAGSSLLLRLWGPYSLNLMILHFSTHFWFHNSTYHKL